MLNSIIIYLRAFGIYVLITIPTLALPPLYFMSIYIVLIYGWFACGLFTILKFFLEQAKLNVDVHYGILAITIPMAVAFAFQMIQEYGAYPNVWQSGALLLFPLAAVISGWISLSLNFRNIKKKKAMLTLDFENNTE